MDGRTIFKYCDVCSLGLWLRKLSNVHKSVIGWVTKNLSRAPPCFGRHVKPLVPSTFAVVNTHQSALGSRVGYGPFFLCVIHKEMCPSSGDINRLMMMMMMMSILGAICIIFRLLYEYVNIPKLN
jgi:hypothetical protein